MKKLQSLKLSCIMLTGLLSLSVAHAVEKNTEAVKKVIHGEYQDWRVLSISHRTDNKTLRAILGNDIAIKSARNNNKTWTDGSIIAKLVWKEGTHPNWAAAIVPSEFAKAEAMIKDSKKFASSGGWGFGFWKNGKMEMHTAEESKVCFGCHAPMKANDYVYTFSEFQK